MIRKNLALALLAVVKLAYGADNSKPEVWIRVFEASSVSPRNLIPAQAIATEILASAGVRLRWNSGRLSSRTDSQAGSCRTGIVQTIDLRFSGSTPEGYKPAALAEAFPFAQNGVRITVFYDRVAAILARRPRSAGRILGHVLAHEVGHMLLGIANHAETGLMKAHWSVDDYAWMGVGNLGFTPEDESLMRLNLGRICSPAADALAADNQ